MTIDEDAVRRACARIAPTWPLDRFIAVNPLWGSVSEQLPEVAAKLGALSGAKLLMPRAWYRDALREGRLRDEDLAAAIAQSGAHTSVAELRALAEREEPAPSVRSRVTDVVDADRDLTRALSWRDFVRNSVSQHCAAYFDDGQAQLGPSRHGGLYASWRRQAMTDRSPRLLMGVPQGALPTGVLPETARAVFETALVGLGVPRREQESYLWSLLLDQNGWASWCAYRRWTARLGGADDDAIEDLLAVRLAWEWMLHASGGPSVARRWTQAVERWPRIDAAAAAARADDWVLQLATELAWRAPVLRALPKGFSATRPAVVSAQVVFCIDVRSEVFRRALEAAGPDVQTLGFAGFFGVPIEYQPLGAPEARPQLPGLLAPRLRAADAGLGADAEARRARGLSLRAAWRGFQRDAVSTFTFVEALGLSYAGKLFSDALGLGEPSPLEDAELSREERAARKPRLATKADGGALDLDSRCDLAAGMLRGMSLTRSFARVVLLAGHGSTSRNNPHAAGLDCGACCGQSGEVNARVAAALLNDPDVRAGLSLRGIDVPATTVFVAALHDTTTDDVRVFDLDEVPASHRGDVSALRGRLGAAGVQARAERAPALGIDARDPAAVERAVRARAADWAQVRPEWGLANNAALIVAPRERCRHIDLGGRSFLHEYRHEEDAGYAVLELIMTAPMVVTHWINFQYYVSTVDNGRYGSGNKVLHNVVGAHVGVFEGNGGDLRVGLPMQSLHDGARWVHTPLRLCVFIEAPRPAIDAVVRKHPTVRDLVANGWISLVQIDEVERALYALRGGAWHRETPAEGHSHSH